MRRHIKDMINDMGIVVLYGPLEAKGMYVDDYRAIILDNNLSEEEEEMVLLHGRRRGRNLFDGKRFGL